MVCLLYHSVNLITEFIGPLSRSESDLPSLLDHCRSEPDSRIMLLFIGPLCRSEPDYRVMLLFIGPLCRSEPDYRVMLSIKLNNIPFYDQLNMGLIFFLFFGGGLGGWGGGWNLPDIVKDIAFGTITQV